MSKTFKDYLREAEGSLSEGNDKIIFKGKEIDTDTIEYDMQDFSDLIFELEIGVKYTDGTEVAEEDMDDLMYNDQLIDWVRDDYMDRMQDQADMMRDSDNELDRIKTLSNASIGHSSGQVGANINNDEHTGVKNLGSFQGWNDIEEELIREESSNGSGGNRDSNGSLNLN